MFNEYTGAVIGGSLGYAVRGSHGILSGIHEGWKRGRKHRLSLDQKKVNKKMRGTPRSQSSSRGRSMSVSSSRHSRYTMPSTRSSWKDDTTAPTTRIAGKKYKIKKSITDSHNKAVKISKKFKKMVHEASLVESGVGIYKLEQLSQIYNLCTGSQQTAWTWTQNPYVGSGGGTAIPSIVPGFDFVHFSPDRVMDAASILFNNKTINTQNYNYKNDPDNKNFNITTSQIKIEVVSSSVYYELHNNSQVTKTLIFYEFVPKVNILGTDPFIDPLGVLQGCFDQDYQNGILKSFTTNGTPWPLVSTSLAYTASLPSLQSTEGNYVSQAGISPGLARSFKHLFSVNKRKFVLEPGQSTSFVIKGPQNHVYDYGLFWDGGSSKTATSMFPSGAGAIPTNQGRKVVYPKGITSIGCFCEIPQVSIDIEGNAAYAGYVVDPLTGGGANVTKIFDDAVVIKQIFNYKIKAPAETTPVLNHDAKFIYNSASAAQAPADIARVDEENPTNREINPRQ